MRDVGDAAAERRGAAWCAAFPRSNDARTVYNATAFRALRGHMSLWRR
jgi:hypothetical protein